MGKAAMRAKSAAQNISLQKQQKVFMGVQVLAAVNHIWVRAKIPHHSSSGY